MSARQAHSDWEASISVQRNRLADHLDDNPSLKPLLPQALAAAHRKAGQDAVTESGVPASTLPEASPRTVNEALDGSFWPF